MDTPSFDVASFDTTDASNVGVEFEIRHPITDARTGIFITVLGLESEAAREIREAQTVKAQRAMQRAGRMVFDSPQAMKDQRIDLCVACTKGWRNMKYKGAELPFTPANARKLYSEIGEILKQVDAAIADQANFFKS